MSVSSESPQCADEMPKQFSEEEALQFVCNSCGAAVITDKNTAATFCAFCGSEKIIPDRLIDTEKPDCIIPFNFGRASAVEAFFKWCKAGRFTPTDFVKDSNVEKLTGLFIPVFLLDCDTDLNITANASKVSYISSGGRKNNHITKTESFYTLVRQRKMRFERIIIDGDTRIDDQIMEDIEPYDLSATEGFDVKYLAGFFAEKSTLSPETLEERLNVKLGKFHECIFNSTVKKYTSVTDIVDESVHQKPEVHYALLPVWILYYKYLGKTYTFVMNGQTGKIAGEPPVSIFKVMLLGLVLLPVIMLFCGFIGGLIMGGF